MAKDRRKKRKRRKKGQPGFKEYALLSIAAVFLVCAIVVIGRSAFQDKKAKDERKRNAASSESSIEESSMTLKLTVSVEGEKIPCIKLDDGIYVGFDELNEKALHGGLIVDEKSQQVFYTTLKDGKQVFSLPEIPRMEKLGTTFVQLDWFASTFGLTVEQEDDRTYHVQPVEQVDESTILKAQLPAQPISMFWFQDFTGDYNDDQKAMIKKTKGNANVMSPTWYSLQEDGTLSSRANKKWVKWAHKYDMQVWALVDNAFDDALTLEVLSDEAKRETLINQLLEQCQKLGLDGINLDFEGLSEETAPYFIEFVREAGAVLRPDGYILSVDVSVPMRWSSYYRRDLLAAACDYCIVMAYDEHYSGSEAGSVSSMKFMETAVQNMLAQVPAEKLILGIPFYTRVWTITESETTCASWTMNAVSNYMVDWELEPVYDEETGQDLMIQEDEDTGTVYKCWIENAKSVQKRLDCASQNQLAGVAAWKVGMEAEDIWPLMQAYMKQEGATADD